MVTQPKSIATVVVVLAGPGARVVDADPGGGHLGLGGQRRDLGDRADRGGLAHPEAAGDEDLDRDRRRGPALPTGGGTDRRRRTRRPVRRRAVRSAVAPARPTIGPVPGDMP